MNRFKKAISIMSIILLGLWLALSLLVGHFILLKINADEHRIGNLDPSSTTYKDLLEMYGKPIAKKEVNGDIVWYYKDFLVEFIIGDLNNPEFINSIQILRRSDKFKTFRGIKVGDSEKSIYNPKYLYIRLSVIPATYKKKPA